MSNQIPCVGAVILDEDGRLCLIRRGKEPSKGLWSFPGGRVESGESDEEAVVREVLEETALRVSVADDLGYVYLPAPDGREYAIHDFLIRLVGSHAPVAGDDADEAAFFTVDEVRNLHTTPGLIDFLVDGGILEP